jgi:hypothetical protein
VIDIYLVGQARYGTGDNTALLKGKGEYKDFSL